MSIVSYHPGKWYEGYLGKATSSREIYPDAIGAVVLIPLYIQDHETTCLILRRKPHASVDVYRRAESRSLPPDTQQKPS